MKISKILIFIVSFQLVGCQPTYDGSTEETAKKSLEKMYPNFDANNFNPEKDEFPPGVAALMAYSLGLGFGTIKVEGVSSKSEQKNHIAKVFHGMTGDEMAEYVASLKKESK